MTHLNSTMVSRPSLNREHFDVVVIGGGINGVAIARECARANRRTLLVEQNDFAAGTTSRSTRLIHGGLRYLEHGDFAQVRESLREREHLARTYPHLVTPLQFLLALDGNGGRSTLAVRAGLWLYRRLGGAGHLCSVNSNPQERLERLLGRGRNFSLFSFEDAQCEFPERLVAEWLREANEAGCCTARNHTEVLEVIVRNGRATGVRLRDRINGNEESIDSAHIINATGPWADRVCQSSGVQTKHPMVGGVRGSHLVLPKFDGAPDAAVYAEASDGRPIFVVPWNKQILMGTTEVPDNGNPEQVQPSDDEVEYLLSSLKRLFPQVPFGLRDVHYTFAGVRPLPYSPDSNPSAITRRHIFHNHADDGATGLISVIGGKLTTAVTLARECVATIGISAKHSSAIGVGSHSEIENLIERHVSDLAAAGGIGIQSARGLVEWFGTRGQTIVQLASQNETLRVPLCSATDHIVAEGVYAITSEAAVTLADVLLRRVPIALGPSWSAECGRECAGRIGAAMQWDDHKTATELEGFELERSAFLRNPRAIRSESFAH